MPIKEYHEQIASLKEQVRNLEKIIIKSSSGYHSLDPNGIVVEVNSVWLETLGYDYEEVIGHSFGEFLEDSFREKFKKYYPILKEKREMDRIVFTMKRKDGKNVNLTFSGTASFDDNGNYIRSHAVFVNPRREFEELSEKELVYLENKNLSKSRLELMGEMISAIAHQWRQPLNSLGLHIQDVMDTYEFNELTPEYIKNFETNSMDLVNYMSDTIDDFRNFFRSEEEVSRFTVTGVILNSLKMVQSQLMQNKIDFKVICDCKEGHHCCENDINTPECIRKSCYIKSVRNEFIQVILNIISNSKHFILENKEHLKGKNGFIQFDINPVGSNIHIKIFNNGKRIPEDIIDRVFEPYFTTKKEGEGVGIGLYMSKIIIEKHMKGKIEIKNTNEGVITEIIIPSER